MKKIVGIFIAVLLVSALCLPLTASAVSDACGKYYQNLTWSINDEHTVLTIEGDGEMKKYGYYSNYVPWWDYRDSVTTLVLPEGITYISDYAFCYFSKLENVYIPTDNVKLGYESFYGCSSLKRVAIGTADGTTSDNINIGAEAFEQCKNLTDVYISRALKKVEYDGFEQCYALKNFYYGGTEEDFEDNVEIDEGSDNGNYYLTNADRKYRYDIWTRWDYDVENYWAKPDSSWLFAASPFFIGNTDFGKFDHSRYMNDGWTYWLPLPDGSKAWEIGIFWKYDETSYWAYLFGREKKISGDFVWYHDDKTCWHLLPNGVRVHERPIEYSYDTSSYSATLPDGTVLSGSLVWENDKRTCWQTLPNGTKVNEKKIEYVFDDTSYSADLPDGTVISGSFEWKSDGLTHWHILPNGDKLHIALHSVQGNACSVCGSTNLSATYIDKDGNTVPFSLSDVKEITSQTTSLTGGEYLAFGTVSLRGRLEVSADSTIILADGCQVNCPGGIHVPSGKTLTICSQTLDPYNMGCLNATGAPSEQAGIGSNVYENNSHVIICGGRIKASGGLDAAGIGSGETANSIVDIYNGIIEATGGAHAAGIGSGYGSIGRNDDSKCVVNIHNGNVKAWGGVWGAGIGGGYMGSFHVNIYNGTVEAWGGDRATGIGSGTDARGGTVYIKESANVTGHGGDQWCSGIDNIRYRPVTGFTLSGGNLWIVIAGGVLILGGVAAVIIVSKKKKKAKA